MIEFRKDKQSRISRSTLHYYYFFLFLWIYKFILIIFIFIWYFLRFVHENEISNHCRRKKKGSKSPIFRMENSINSSTFWLWGLNRRLDFEFLQIPFLFLFGFFIHQLFFLYIYRGTIHCFCSTITTPEFTDFSFIFPIRVLSFWLIIFIQHFLQLHCYSIQVRSCLLHVESLVIVLILFLDFDWTVCGFLCVISGLSDYRRLISLVICRFFCYNLNC